MRTWVLVLALSVAVGFALCPQLVSATVTMDNDSSSSVSVITGDNYPNLTNAALNLWHNTNTALAQVGVARDGTTNGVDASGCAWYYTDYPTNSWTKYPSTQEGCNFFSILPTSPQLVYGLMKTGFGTCGTSGHMLLYNNSGASDGGWHNYAMPNGTCITIASSSPTNITVGTYGTLCAIAGGVLYCLDGAPPTGYWHAVTGGLSNPTMIAVYDATKIFMANSSSVSACALHIVVGPSGSASCTSTTAVTGLSGVTRLTVNPANGDLWATAATVSGSNLYRNDTNTGTWSEIYGLTADNVAVSGQSIGGFWIIHSGNLYRASSTSIVATGSYTSHTICHDNGLPTQCPSATHTPSLFFSFNGVKHVGGGSTQGPGTSPDTVNTVQMSDTCGDPLAAIEADPVECAVNGSSGGWTTCTTLGVIFQMSMISITPVKHGVFTVTHIKTSPNGSPCHLSIFSNDPWCTYYVIPDCPNPPPYAFTDSRVIETQHEGDPAWGFLAVDECLKFNYNNSYTCFGSYVVPVNNNPNLWCATPANVLAMP